METQKKPKMQRFTFRYFDTMFPDDATCLDWLRSYLYPDGIHCKKCDRVTKHHRTASRPSYSCDNCGHHVHPTAGTIFHKSSTSLRTWFRAIYLMASTRCGISAKQIERETGVTYKTAWRMFKQIRMLLQDDAPEQVGGLVEMDETYFGGRRRAAKRTDGRSNAGRPGPNDPQKTPIIGIVERNGRVIARTAPSTGSEVILGMFREYVMTGSTVYTDEYRPYAGIDKMRRGYDHRRIHHGAKIYVRGDIHTNSVEGFWSLIKRGIGGVYHSVSKKHLQSYLDEYSFRYNHRHDIEPMFLTFLRQVEKSEE